jgi:hypothetical protein
MKSSSQFGCTWILFFVLPADLADLEAVYHIYQPSNRSLRKTKQRRHPISLKDQEKCKVQHIKTAENEFGSQLDLPISPFRLLNTQFLS